LMASKATSALKAGPNLRRGCFIRQKFKHIKFLSRFFRPAHLLIQEGKFDPYHHLKDWVKILKERKQNQTDLCGRVSNSFEV
jgi:hypothetical protein